MSEYTEIFGRRIKDLTTPNSELNKTSELVGNIKIPAGNFPTEFSGCEGLRLIDLKNYVYTPVDPEIYNDIELIKLDLNQTKISLNLKISQEEQRAELEESKLDTKINVAYDDLNSKVSEMETNLEAQIASVGVGNKAYKTYALMDADKANIPAKSKVTVTNDETASNNGDWQWDGVVFTKSAYDSLTQAKNYVDKTGYASIVGLLQSNINYVTADRNLVFTNTMWVVTGTNRYQLTTPQTLNLPNNATYRIEYEVSTGLLSTVAYNQARTEGKLVVGFVHASATWLKTLDFMFSVDGVNYDPVSAAQLYTDKYINNTASVVAEALHVSFNSVENKLTFGTNVQINSGKESFNISAQTVDVPTTTGNFLITYDRPSQTVSFKTNANRLSSDFVIGKVRCLAGVKPAFFFDFPYTFDGELIKQLTSRTAIAINTQPTQISINTVTNKLNIGANTVRIIGNNINTVLPSADLDIPTASGFYTLDYDIGTKQVSINSAGLVKADTQVTFGKLQKFSTHAELTGFDYYNINGATPTKATAGQLYSNTITAFNIDTVNKKLITLNTGRVIYDAGTKILPSSSIDLPTTVGVYRVELNLVNDTVQIIPSATLQATMTVAFAKLIVTSTSYTVYGVDVYAIDGAAPTSNSVSYTTGQLVATNKSNINFDFVNKQLVVTANQVRLLYGKTTVLLPEVILDISSSPTFWNRLIYNTSTSLFSIKRTISALSDNEIQVGLLHAQEKQVYGIPYYSINGAAGGGDKTILSDARYIIPYGVLEANYELSAELPAYRDIVDADAGDFTKVYDRYDALVSTYPDYIVKTLLGNDALGNPIYQYRFNMQEVDTASLGIDKPKILFVSSVHGYEKAGVYNTYFTMKHICENWQSDPRLEALKHGVDFLIIPIAVPTGFNNLSRKNHNGVDCARNFPTGFTVIDPSEPTYGGQTPLSEPEAVILDAFMANNRDAIYFGSHHNFFTPEDGSAQYLWNASATHFGMNLGKNLILGQTLRTRKRYSWFTNDSRYIGYANLSAPNGSEGKQATEAYGIQGGTFENCYQFVAEPTPTLYSSVVATLGVETLVNWFLLNVKHACALYNWRINL